MGPDGADAAAAVPQEPQAQVCTLLCLLLKQQLRELENSTGGNQCLDRQEGALGPRGSREGALE